MKPIIEVKDLSKKYHLGAYKPYQTLRDSLVGLAKRGLKRETLNKDEFWALDRISFSVNPGQIIGVIGKNGAGKSTLLKILSRITPPTSGEAILRGRVASLLEIGTGFNSELTGRENVYLNGSILGMTRREIRRKYDSIVDFAGISKFLDTPVKYYSSGMYTRLAFAVATHLDSDILLLDEVLAVGDSEFQRKSLKKMKDVTSNEGRTVLLVSHNMTSIQAIAQQVIYLVAGKSNGIMPVDEAIQKYLYSDSGRISAAHYKSRKRTSDKEAHILEGKLLDSSGHVVNRFKVYQDIYIEIKWVNNAGIKISPNIMVVNQNNVTAMVATDAPIDFDGSKKKAKGVYISRVKIPANLLNANEYSVHLALDCHSPRFCVECCNNALSFSVWDPMDEHSIARGMFTSVRDDAVFWPALEWSFKKVK